MWNKFEFEYGMSCVKLYRFYSSVAISDLVLDILIYFLPVPHLWQLHLPIKERLGVIGIFLLGSIVIAIGIIRTIIFQWVISFISAQPLAYASNATWYSTGTLFWHLAENVVALLACCLPSYARPIKDLLKMRKTTGSSPSCTRANSRMSPWGSPYHQDFDDQAPSDSKQQVLPVTLLAFCSPEEAVELFQPLVDVGPLQQVLMPSTFDKHSGHLDWICAEGDFKGFSQAGLAGWSAEKFKRPVALHAELVEKCRIPPALVTRWSGIVRVRQRESYGRLSDMRTWNIGLTALSWYTDGANHDFLSMMDRKAQVTMRIDTDQGVFVSYINTTWDDPLGYRTRALIGLAN
ncbi:hypothetical protein DL765_005370 [Monosporascus sp. GIB2]|nr:hypothetical protein DL765_005370 [Monosporascus sp. GIB2]